MILQLKMLMKSGWLMLQSDIAKIGPFTLQSLRESTLLMVMTRLGTLVVCLIFYPALFLLVSIALLVTITLMTPLIALSSIIRKRREYLLTFLSLMKLRKVDSQTRL